MDSVTSIHSSIYVLSKHKLQLGLTRKLVCTTITHHPSNKQLARSWSWSGLGGIMKPNLVVALAELGSSRLIFDNCLWFLNNCIYETMSHISVAHLEISCIPLDRNGDYASLLLWLLWYDSSHNSSIIEYHIVLPLHTGKNSTFKHGKNKLLRWWF